MKITTNDPEIPSLQENQRVTARESQIVKNKKIVTGFIEDVWNNQNLKAIPLYIHDEYYDHSFIAGIPPAKDGLVMWIKNTSAAFEHTTHIESMLAEADQVAARIRFQVKHTGKWRNLEPTGKEVMVKGFRYFRLKDEKIIAHWALIDGEKLESELTAIHQGCKLPA